MGQQRRRIVRSTFVSMFVMCSTLVGATPAHASTATLTGFVACQKGGEVVGMWVARSGGGSQWAKLSSTSAKWVKAYSVTVTIPAKVRFDIGCGGTPKKWGSNNSTPTRSVSESGKVSAVCTEKGGAPAERCSWWGKTIYVGMPFSGVFNRDNAATPGDHPVYDGLKYADWSTDISVAKGGDTPSVYPRIYGPYGVYNLKVMNTWKGCAGTGVRVGIFKGKADKPVGTVSYAHLDDVPKFTSMQAISTKTRLGKLRWWDDCSGWDVDTAEGVHTHIEVGTVSGKACPAYKSEATLPDTRRIGRIVPGTDC